MSKFLIDGKIYDPIKVGDVGDWDEGNPDAVCDDCGAQFGEQHKEGCAIERCPICGAPLMICGHIIYDVPDDYQVEEKSEMN